MPAKRNPFAVFLDADLAATSESGDPHTRAWWAAEFEISDPSIVSSWCSGRRRIGAYHERRVFRILERYWTENPPMARYAFTVDEYRRSVPTAKQVAQRAKVRRAKVPVRNMRRVRGA